MNAKIFVKIICSMLITGIFFTTMSCSKLENISNGSDSDMNGDFSSSDDRNEENNSSSNKDTTEKETTKKETTKNETTKEETTTKRTFKLNTSNPWKYSKDIYTDVTIRNLTIDTGWGGETVTISQMSDMHVNYCTSNDLKDPVLNSTYQNRKWLMNGASLPNVERCMTVAKNSDMIVLTGDIYDYYSEGVVLKTNEYIFNKYDNVVGCMGNHEPVRRMQGTVPETKSTAELRQLVANSWCNDITYDSFIVKNKVMLVLLDNSSGHFLSAQVPLLKADLQEARDNGYAVLVFYHIPINTGDSKYVNLKTTYDKSEREYINLYNREDFVGPHSTGADKDVYDLIRNNGDIIKGCFGGHEHGDYYSEILAKTPSGVSTMIPQYIIAAAAGDKGHVAKITIK